MFERSGSQGDVENPGSARLLHLPVIGTAAPPAASANLPGRMRELEQRHPEWWAMLAAAGAWVWMAATPQPHVGRGGHAETAGSGTLGIGVMLIAMMLPLTVASIRHVAHSGRWRRHRRIACFLAGYLGVWMLIMLAIGAAWGVAASFVGRTAAAVGVMAIAALWEIAPGRLRRRHGCDPSVPLPSHGWRADADCARYGATAGIRCAASCWALMAACVAFAHSLPVMVVLFGVQLGGRYHQWPARALAALAVLGVCLASLAARSAGAHHG